MSDQTATIFTSFPAPAKPAPAPAAARTKLLLEGPIFSTLADRRVDLATLVKDDDALAEHIRQNVAGTFHPVGTCRMGQANDRAAVVDTAGRVRGIAGLRVIDASIMPTVPRGNTNIPTIMLAEKISEAMADEARAAA